MVEQVKSRFSLNGYSLWYAVKDNLKEVLRVGVPLVIAWVVTKDPALTAVATAAGGLVIKGFEYFYKASSGD